MKLIREWKKEFGFASYWDNTKNVKEVLRRSSKTCWVVESNKKVVGFRLAIDDIQNRVWSRLIVISKDYRGRGVGSFLVRETNKKLKKMGFRKVYTYVEENNITSIEWHVKTGYKKVTILKDWYKKGDNGILFIKNL